MKKFLVLFIVYNVAFGQIKSSVLEDKIYASLDFFVANPTLQNLNKLDKETLQFKPKSKSEFLAIVLLNCNKGYYENQLGFTKNAIVSYEKAWKIFQEKALTNYDITQNCLLKLSNLYTIIGDLDNAENTIKQYYYIANATNDLDIKYAAVLNLSNVYQISGRKKNAIQLIEKTLKEDNLTAIQKGNLFNNLGSNYLLFSLEIANKNTLQLAKKSFEKAINYLKDSNEEQEHLANVYSNLSKVYTLNLDYKTASLYLDKANALLNLNHQEPRKLAKFYLDNAFLYFQQTNYTQANVFIDKIFQVLIPNFKKSNKEIPLVNSLYAETVLLDALDLKAQLYLKNENTTYALKTYELSFYIESLFQQLYTYENSKILNQINSKYRTEKCIEIYYNLYFKNKDKTYLKKALQLCENSKWAVLKSLLQTSKVESKDEKDLQQELQDYNIIIIKEQQKLEIADISIINNAIKKQNLIMLKLKAFAKSKNNLSNQNINFTSLFLKLKNDNVVLLDYFIGVKNSYFFTIYNDEVTLKKINLQAKKIANFLDYFSNSDKITNAVLQYNNDANELYKTLEIPSIINHKKLIVCPDGIVNFIPFEALITKKTTTTNFSKMNFLIKKCAVGYTNSVFLYLNSVPFKHNKDEVLGVFPVFENSDLELTYSKKELKAIQQNFKGKYLVNNQATFANFKTNASNYSILHLSTHASSGNTETPASIKFYDQEILYSQLYNLNIKPNLVLLSACETGLGKWYINEGAMSVSRGFQMAGAQNLLFSLWKVNDYTTSVFMEKFYKNSKNGASYFNANYDAKLSYLKDSSISNIKKSPYYWCSFVYYGTLENNNSSNYFIYILLSILVAITLLLWIKRKKWINFKRF